MKSVADKKKNQDTIISEVEYREMPRNIQAEQVVIGALLINNEAINRIGDYLNAEHFFEPVHQKIFSAILKFSEKGLTATPVTLKNYFDKDAALAEIGGAEYLAKLAVTGSSIINIESHARIIFDLAMRRILIGIGEEVVNEAFDVNSVDDDAKLQIERAEQKLFNLASEGASDTGFVALKTSLADAIAKADIAHKRTDKLSGVSTKFRDLDEFLGGLQNSDLLILAGRPSMGKTALAINIAVNCCMALYESHPDDLVKPAVGFFSLEMSSEQLAARMISMEAAVSSSKMRVGTLTDDEFTKVVEANKNLYQLPFFIDDTPALSISAVRTRARRLKRKNNLALLVIDYLQLVRGSSKQSETSRVQEISEITQGLKAIAKELNIPVIALSQLSRAVEQREDKRPQLSDLRESGSIEQDADVVMFIYREEYYLERKMPTDETSEKFREWQAEMNKCLNLTEIIIAKQRNGPVGTAKLYFDASTTKFKDFVEGY